MNCKLIALDIDGTLLNDQKEVQPEVREALLRAREAGIHIALLSGRMPYAVEMIESKLGFSCVKACNAGTCVILDSGETIMDFIDAETTRNVFHEVALKDEVPLWMYRERSWMVSGVDFYVNQESQIIKKDPELIEVDVMCDLWKRRSTGPNKLLFGADPAIITKIVREMEPFRMKGLDFAQSAEEYLEVFPKGANKGQALRIICEALQVKTCEVMAFGDQELDLPMLVEAGYAVAMENAIPLLKEHANFVTKSNNEAGVAYALEQLLGL